VSVDHYENFPVASLLCPPALRAPISAIYHFARTADDIADEGDAPTAQRLEQLQAYRQALQDCLSGRAGSGPWAKVFAPLQQAIADHALPGQPMFDLIEAFERDTANPRYPDRDALLGYCRLSANPVGRLLLHLWHIHDPLSLRQSDAICTALQLINFWQDLSRDLPRGRNYLPAEDEARHGPGSDALVGALLDWSEQLMRSGAPLALRVPGRAGWELRLVVQGGLRIAQKLRQGMLAGHSPFQHRPALRATDGPPMLWRALRMRSNTSETPALA
jgi:hydroxysqualene synthase